MRRVYHLVLPSAWVAAALQSYRAPSLETEGFIHCSNAEQVACAANRFYASARELAVLVIDPERLTVPLEDEASVSGELFPHIYGPINAEAVVEVRRLERDADGLWRFSQ